MALVSSSVCCMLRAGEIPLRHFSVLVWLVAVVKGITHTQKKLGCQMCTGFGLMSGPTLPQHVLKPALALLAHPLEMKIKTEMTMEGGG